MSNNLPLDEFPYMHPEIKQGRPCEKCLRRPATGPGLCDACHLFPAPRRDGIAMAEIIRLTLPEFRAVGVTGTRKGMTPAQRAWWDAFLEALQAWAPETDFRHGDCVGFDNELDDLAALYGFPIFIHPPFDEKLWANCGYKETGSRCSHPPKHYHARNRDIVDMSSITIGNPQSMTHRAGGTWYTINYAMSNRKPTVIVSPEGLATIKQFINE